MRITTKRFAMLFVAFGLAVGAHAQTPFWAPANTEGGTVPALAASGITVLAGTDGDGVYRSIDDGDNWAPSVLGNVNVRGLAVSGGSGAAWAATYGDGAYRSADLFLTTAAPIAAAPDDLLAIAIADTDPSSGAGTDGDVFVGTDGDGVYVSSNNGGTFTAVNTGLPANAIIRSLYVEVEGAGTDLNRVWAGTHGQGLYRLDYTAGPAVGTAWVQANGTLDELDDAVVHAVAIDAGGDVYVGTSQGVYVSTDDGLSWTKLTDPDVDGKVVRSLLVFDDGTEYILAGTDGDFAARAEVASATSATGWTQFLGNPTPPNGLSGLQSRTLLSLLYFDGLVFAGTMDRGVHRSEDGGETWDQVSAILLNAVIQALTFDASGRLWAGTQGFGILMTDDFGAATLNWSHLNRGITNRYISAVAASGNVVFAGTRGAPGGFFRTNDSGANWFLTGLGNTDIYTIAVSPGGDVYVGYNIGQVGRSTDNGLTWHEIGVARTPIYALGFESAATLYAGTFGEGVFKSTDGGSTWSQTGMTSGYAWDLVVGTNPVTGNPAVIAATSTGVQYSENGGTTWTTYNTGLTVTDVRSLAFSLGGDLLAGTYGDGVFVYDTGSNSWVRDGLPGTIVVALKIDPSNGATLAGSKTSGTYYKAAATSTDKEAETVPGTYVLLQNYPNPFNPSTRVAFELPEAGAVRVAVYDLLGREVRVLVDGTLPAGRHDLTFDAGTLPGGVYVYRLQADGHSVSRKMVLMK